MVMSQSPAEITLLPLRHPGRLTEEPQVDHVSRSAVLQPSISAAAATSQLSRCRLGGSQHESGERCPAADANGP